MPASQNVNKNLMGERVEHCGIGFEYCNFKGKSLLRPLSPDTAPENRGP
jgi:hypothetical protein